MKFIAKIFLLYFFSISSSLSYEHECLNQVEDFTILKDILTSEIQQQIEEASSIELLPYGNFPTHANNICIKNINIDKKNHNFYVITIIESKNFLFQGKFKYLSLIPVLHSDILKDTIITENDIEVIPIAANKIIQNTITDKSLLIGMAAKINLKADKPINLRELYKPVLIRKNELINVVYKKNNVQIKMTGLALEDGTKNDLIKIKNARSGQIITVIVTDIKSAVVE